MKKIKLLIAVILFATLTGNAQYTKLLDFKSIPITGSSPSGTLISDGTYLYGMTSAGGTSGKGTIFKIKPDGTGYDTLLNFNGQNGESPFGSLYYDGTFLYGMTSGNEYTSANNFGNIFKIKPDGTDYDTLINFNSNRGEYPYGNLISDGIYLYGMTQVGGNINGQGNVFKIKPDGSGYDTLITFSYGFGNNPLGSLLYDGTFLYGMTSGGGSSGGIVFKIKPDGTTFSNLLSFSSDPLSSNGKFPYGSLVSVGNYLYGTTAFGGLNDSGTVFRIKPDGSAFEALFNFNGSNGRAPKGDLISIGSFLYGMTSSGGANGYGNIFKIDTNGTSFDVLMSFNGINGSNPLYSSFFYDGTFLYGMTASGGAYGGGNIFKIKPDGTGFKELKDFNYITASGPTGNLVSDGTNLFGMTPYGGENNGGTIFKIKPDGTGDTVIINFNNKIGSNPQGSLFFYGGFLYGMTNNGGKNGYGNIFKIKPDGTGYDTLLCFNYISGQGPNGSFIFEGNFLYGVTYENIFKIKPDGSNYTDIFDFSTANDEYGHGPLYSDGTYLYGTTQLGGSNRTDGIIYKIKPDGTGYEMLMDCTPFVTANNPEGSLISDGSFLYGMAPGGPNNEGVVFKIKPDGTGYVNIVNFDSVNGSGPLGSLIANGNFLYGMTVGVAIIIRGSYIEQDGMGQVF